MTDVEKIGSQLATEREARQQAQLELGAATAERDSLLKRAADCPACLTQDRLRLERDEARVQLATVTKERDELNAALEDAGQEFFRACNLMSGYLDAHELEGPRGDEEAPGEDVFTVVLADAEQLRTHLATATQERDDALFLAEDRDRTLEIEEAENQRLSARLEEIKGERDEALAATPKEAQ